MSASHPQPSPEASAEPAAVIDFDAAVRDPEHPLRHAAADDSGDKLHPPDAGDTAMAQAMSLDVGDGQT